MKIVKKILFLIAKQLDKIILGLILLLSIYLLMQIMEEKSKSDQELSLILARKLRKTDYKPIDTKNISSQSVFDKTVFWEKSKKRNKDEKSPDYIVTHTDFILPFKIVRSIAIGANNKLIPFENYLIGKCPITNNPLPKPDSEQLRMYTSTYDYDGDGIPDVMEKKLGLNPDLKDDGLYDSDKDSFSNITEFRINPDYVLNPDKHPPFINRIILEKITSTMIPIFIKNILKTGYVKNTWKIQINIFNGSKWRTKFLHIGDKFKVTGVEYIINDIQPDIEEILNPRLGIIEEVDKSVIILSDSLGQTLHAIINEPVFEPNKRVYIKDLYTGKTILTKINNIITLKGNDNSKPESYKLIAIGSNDNQLTYEDEKTKKKYTVRKTSDYIKPLK